MSDLFLEEVKALKDVIEEKGRLWTDYKKDNDKRLDAIEARGEESGESKERFEKMDKAMDELTEKSEALETAMKRRQTQHLDVDGKELTPEQAERKDALNAYARKGFDRLSEAEKKSLTANSDPDGGFFVRPEVSNEILKTVTETSPIRSVASVITIGSGSFEQPKRVTAHTGATWSGETGDPDDSAGPQVGMLTIFAHMLSADPKASQTLLDDSEVSIEQWLADEVALNFAVTENTAFVLGDGNSKPRGFLTYTAGTDDDEIEQIPSGTSGEVVGDGLIDLQVALKEEYQLNASWIMKRATVGNIRKLKSSDLEYIWQPGLRAGEADLLLGRPILKANDMPAVAADSLSIAYGDFRRGYKIVDRKGISILRNPYTARPFVTFFTTKRVGGDVTINEAIKIQKLEA